MDEKKNPFQRAVHYILTNYTLNNKPINQKGVMYVLDCSHAWFYGCMLEGTTSLPMALKLEILTRGEVKWNELCPRAAEDVLAIHDRITITA